MYVLEDRKSIVYMSQGTPLEHISYVISMGQKRVKGTLPLGFGSRPMPS